MRALWLSLICAALVATGGCRLFGKTEAAESSAPPDYLEVVGVGDARTPAGGPAAWTQTLGPVVGPVTATADIATSPGGPEALMVSRAAARRQALRQLTAKLQAAPMDGQARFHDWLIGAPAAQRMEFENLIEERANVLWRDQSGKSVAVASIPTGTVAAWVAQHMPASAKPDENALNRNAAALAGKDAKARLREQLLQMDLGDGRTLAKAVEDNPAIGSQLDGILHVVPIDEYPATGIPGVCKAKIYFDKNIARGLAAHPRKRWWLF